MKMLLPVLVTVAVGSFLMPASWAKGKPKRPAQPATATNVASPTEALAPYVNHVDQLLALRRNVPPKQAALYNQAPGRIATLRSQFATEREKADGTNRAKFNAAITTCDVLTSALNERQKVLGDITASQSVEGSGKLEAGPRKDNLTQGIKGGSTAKAAGAIVERDRERAAARAAKARAMASDDALTAMSANRWNKRSIELREQITAAYAKIK
jgi:hypothetical protein